MLILSGYNFSSDISAIDPFPTSINNLNQSQIQNGIFDHFRTTADTTSAYNSNIPTTWDILTLIDCNFNGNINAGNVEFLLNELSGIKIKRRKTTDFDWITLTEIPITSPTELSFIFNDKIASSLQEYQYAFVPILQGGIEGDYIINTITTNFNGVFICDLDTIYRFYAGVQYGTTEQTQKIGTFEPFGRQYPVVVSNALINYQKGSVSGTVLNSDFYNTGDINRLAIVQQRKGLLDFLTNKKAKILKDLTLCIA